MIQVMTEWAQRLGTVRDWMTRNPRTVPVEASVGDVARVMRAEGIRHVIVLDAGAIVGIVSNRDLRGPLPGEAPHAAPAAAISQVMSDSPVSVTANTPLAEAARAMLDLRVGALPVTDDLQLVGILTKSDALEALLTFVEREPSPTREPSPPG